MLSEAQKTVAESGDGVLSNCVPKVPTTFAGNAAFYRVSINSFPDYKHLLQENYMEYKHIFFTIT